MISRAIRRVCLGTNMADSNCRQWGGNVGENQELLVRIIFTYEILVAALATLYIKQVPKEGTASARKVNLST